MKLRKGMTRLLVVAFFAVLCTVDTIAQELPQKPSGESPITRPQNITDNKATEWTEVCAHT